MNILFKKCEKRCNIFYRYETNDTTMVADWILIALAYLIVSVALAWVKRGSKLENVAGAAYYLLLTLAIGLASGSWYGYLAVPVSTIISVIVRGVVLTYRESVRRRRLLKQLEGGV